MLKLLKVFNEEYEDEMALIDTQHDCIILKGDYYHNKIFEQVEGFFVALDYLNINYELKEEIVNKNHELFEFCGFCEEED